MRELTRSHNAPTLRRPDAELVAPGTDAAGPVDPIVLARVGLVVVGVLAGIGSH
jgi:hypothetical protein